MLQGTCFVLAALLVSGDTTPGFQFLGYGYDILYGNPRSTEGGGDPGFRTNVFDFTYTENTMTGDGKWQVPDKTTSQSKTGTCSLTQSSTMIYSGYDYQHAVSTGVSLNAGFMGLEFTLSTDFQKTENQTRSNTSVFAQVTAECAAYELTMHTYDHPPVDANFKLGVQYGLTEEYNEAMYMEFIQNFGTHVVTQLDVGGRWGWQMAFDRFNYVSMLDHSVDVNAGIEYAGQVKAGIHVSHSDKTSDYRSVVNTISNNKSFNIGGEFNADVNTWMKSVVANPQPISLTMQSLDTLMNPLYLPDLDSSSLSTKATNMQTAIAGYCSYVQKNQDSQISCEKPQPLPAPQPSAVADNAIKRMCVTNWGAYAMKFTLKDLTSDYAITKWTDWYDDGSTVCVDGNDIGAYQGDYIQCQVSAMAGATVDCYGADVVYDQRATKQANFVCRGTTLSVDCKFDSFEDYNGVAVSAVV